jgi:hypothetical protein
VEARGVKGRTIVLYHLVRRTEDFEVAALDLFGLVRAAWEKYPGAKLALYLDIDGHRNELGAFDLDMFELQNEFVIGYLGKWLWSIWEPLVQARQQAGWKPPEFPMPERLEIQRA